MCRPEYFDVVYQINPWMDVSVPVDTTRAVAQWERLRETYLEHGHTVHLIEPEPGLPDMVYAANGGVVVNGVALAPRFLHRERRAEGPAYGRWFAAAARAGLLGPGGVCLGQAAEVNEGEGDLLLAGRYLLAGTGFRTSRAAHRELDARLGLARDGIRVVSLDLVDPRYYHLDTALAVLDVPAAVPAGGVVPADLLVPAGGAVPGGAVPGGAMPDGAVPGGAVPGGGDGAAPGGAVPGGAVPGGGDGAAPGGAVPGGAVPGGGDGAAPGPLVAYLPEAFSPESREMLRDLFPDAIVADPGDAAVLGLNAVSDGLHVYLDARATGMHARLRERGFEPVGIEIDELAKGGGGVKCCTLVIRPSDGRPGPTRSASTQFALTQPAPSAPVPRTSDPALPDHP
ncbi:hypothetical protein ET495_12585 [Xylanimonas allomyrinae]|uniref:N-dimethylarginine dimethylaminohydrolase n=2 Tax=Xylanimonas allomyrinae TaxID=2509459 RepID=A0A4P6F3E2_9MICO|nr:hypothetical protein ET495_12585 [Xylanimonas allomyrinae]